MNMDQKPDVRIEPAKIEDVPTILALIRELAEYEKLAVEVVATEDRLRTHLFGPRPVAESLIARVNNEPVGFALFFTNFSTFLAQPGLYLEDLYVRPTMRGLGVGQKLFARLAQIARERNYARVEWVVLNWNTPAIGFYDKLGAIPMNDWLVYRLTGEALEKLATEPK
ncbi:MAG TPA: GNAT family N-acetyltransferase [Phycisphaerae bacterium]|nr:GNAT family N-acetyltransferase [Phycisphaerae bacterium]